MAFANKTDYCGLATTFTSSLSVRDDTENKSVSTYEPQGEDGSTLAIEAFGENASPSNSYALTAAITATAGTLQLGKVVTQGQKKYRLKSVSIGTSANSPVTVSANAELVEASATDVSTNNFSVPAFSLTTAHLAQDIFSAFTIANGSLISCNAEIALEVSKDTLVGSIISNGVGKAAITVGGTVLQTGATAPTITLAQDTDWVITAPLTATNPETAYKSYTFSIKMPLAKVTSNG